MKKHIPFLFFWMAALGSLLCGNGTAQAAITQAPTLSSSSHSINTASTNSTIKVSWTAATSGLEGSSITYEYVLDSVASHTHGSFTGAKGSAASGRAGQLSNTLSVDFSAVTDGTYYFHLRAFDSAGIVSGSSVLNLGPFILDSKPTLGSSPISPSSGDHSKAVTVIITGSKFMSNATAKLVGGARSTGSNPVTTLADVPLTVVSVDSANQITATVPKGTIPGIYNLAVSNGSPFNQSVVVSKAYTATNTAPTASAGTAQTGKLSGGTFSFTLTGTTPTGNSLDGDGDALSDSSFSWTLTSLPASVTSTSSGWAKDVSKTGATQSVVVNVAGTYTFALTVDDGYDKSSAATTTVTVGVESGNNRPVAVASASGGVASPVDPGTTITLTGAISDLDGNTASQYVWVLSNVPTGSARVAKSLPTSVDTTAPTTSPDITQGTGPTASFTPDVVGTYTIGLYIKDSHSTAPLWSDGSGSNSKLTVVANNKPTAKITKNSGDGIWKVGKGVLFTLDGSGSSDPDASDTIAAYAWSQTSGTTVVLSSISAQKPTFTPTVLGTYVFSLTVKDSAGNSSVADTVTVEVTNPPATPSAGTIQPVEMVADVTVPLAGTTADDTATTYAWSIAAVPTGSTAATLTSASGGASTTAGALTGTFKPDRAGTYELSLTVSNSAGVASAAGTVTVVMNTQPVAHAGTAKSASRGATVTLDGKDSTDADGNNLTYAWAATAVPTGVVVSDVKITQSSSSLPTATFTPAVAGVYTFTLTVSDGMHGSTNTDTNTVQVTVSNTVSFTLDIDGDGSYTPLGDGLMVIRYLFSFPGSALTNGAVSATATRSSTADIADYLATAGTTLDVDGNGAVEPLADGLLIVRHLFSFPDAGLINGAVGVGATRTTAADIKAYIVSIMP